ncbi:MFS transporter [Parapusillimonas granuli]|uniref:MFS transporter n=1 Tax=Parapusillimonas granuli TaxID=380911 RepID=A0A853G0M6_9BURK|nr:MFS transporter [Parapusillimonas granuli]MBB5215466.1 MFS family permease [Parapusillimonas granuli]NYT49867.1 MFS transporter [Parapusillimonas granuli]
MPSPSQRFFNKNLILLIICQGLFLTNNVTFIAINGLVGMGLTPVPWMATLPVMGYVVGGALSTGIVAHTQSRYGRKKSFQLGLLTAIGSALLCAASVWIQNFWLLTLSTLIAGYYSANGQLYRFAATELVEAGHREKAISWVLAGGLIGAIIGPNLAKYAKDAASHPFMGAYLALAVVGLLALLIMQFIRFPDDARKSAPQDSGRPLSEIARQPVFIVAALGASLGYGIMNLLMAATPLAMEVYGFEFGNTATVLQWHVIGMFAPGFFTGSLIKRFGVLEVMAAGLLINIACIAVALSGSSFEQFLIALFLLGVGWNFLFTGATTLATQAHTPQERDKAQGAINFAVFMVMAVSSFSSGALVTTQGWYWLNVGSLVPAAIIGFALLGLFLRRSRAAGAAG